MFQVSFLIKYYKKKLQDANGTSKCKVASVMSESPEANASIIFTVVWFS